MFALHVGHDIWRPSLSAYAIIRTAQDGQMIVGHGQPMGVSVGVRTLHTTQHTPFGDGPEWNPHFWCTVERMHGNVAVGRSETRYR